MCSWWPYEVVGTAGTQTLQGSYVTLCTFLTFPGLSFLAVK